MGPCKDLQDLHVCFALLRSYQLTSGYKPAPMDLSFIKLTPSQEAMVDKLAENAHNVWARDRIRQGWTYGIQQVWGVEGVLALQATVS